MVNKGTSTRDKIRQLIECNPELTNVEIANALEISRQLVSHHRTSMGMPRSSPNRACNGCGVRIGRYNSTGFCRKCKTLSYTYEFKCTQCGKINSKTGRDAINRRNSMKYKKNSFDFCNLSCSSRYFGLLEPRQE